MSNKLIDLSALSTYKTQSDAKYQDKLTAGDSISISNNVISVAPTFMTIIGSGSQSVANNTLTELGNVTLSPGNYFITFTCLFDSNLTGYRQCGFSVNNTDLTGFGRSWGDSRFAAPGGVVTQTMVTGSFEVQASSYPNGQKFYFLAKQNSGGSLTATPRCYAFKF